MDVAARSNSRSLLGLSLVSLVIAAVIVFASRSSESSAMPAWRPPAGYAVTDTVPLATDRALRLWTGPSGWYVESLTSGRHEAAVGASSGGGEYTVSEVLGGLVGHVPMADAHAVSVGEPGVAVRVDLHDGVFLVPASVMAPSDVAVPVTPLDANGMPMADTPLVPVAGRT